MKVKFKKGLDKIVGLKEFKDFNVASDFQIFDSHANNMYVFDSKDDFYQVNYRHDDLVWFNSVVFDVVYSTDNQYYPAKSKNEYEVLKQDLEKLLHTEPSTENNTINDKIHLLQILINEYETREGNDVQDKQINRDSFLLIKSNNEHVYVNFDGIHKYLNDYYRQTKDNSYIQTLNKIKYSNFKVIDLRNNQVIIY